MTASILIAIALALSTTVLILLSIKWCLPRSKMTKILVAGLLLGALGGFAATSWLPSAVSALVATGVQAAVYVLTLAWLFYRDPERTPPLTCAPLFLRPTAR